MAGLTRRIAVTSCALLTGAAAAFAAPITPGNLVIYRVGTAGGPALSTTAAAVTLDEYTTAGVLVQSIALPSAVGGAGNLTAVGNAATEGIISRSQDGLSLIFTGYRKAAGTTNPSADAPATTNRVIGSVALNGLVDTTIGLTDPTGTIRSATTVSGTNHYISTSTSIRYVATPGPAATTAQIDARNSRQVNLSDNILYASNGSTTITGKVQTYGTLPTGATAATPQVILGLSDAINGFALFDLDSGIAGADTMYVLSTVQSQLQKWTYNGSTWSQNGSISTAASNLTGISSSGGVALFLTTSSALVSVTDASGYGGTLSGSLATLASASSGTAFRGIGTLAPEPSSLILLAVVGVFAARRR